MESQKQKARSRHMAAKEAQQLKSELVGILGEIGRLVPEPVSTQAAKSSRTVGGFLRALAEALEGTDGTGEPKAIETLGALSDLALLRGTPSELKASIETPSEILRWFSKYLERTLDKPSLRLVE
jgi:hypothetical protein